MRGPNLSRAAWALAVGVAYFAAAKLGLSMAFVAEQVTLVWPPAGIALASVVLLGYRIWPAIALGAFAANATETGSLGTAAGIALGNTLEALTAGWLLHRICFDASLERFRDVLALIGFGAILSPVVSATIGVASLCLGEVEPWSRFGLLWSVWWMGDAMGDLVFAPAILTWARWSRQRWTRAGFVEAATLVVALVAVCLFVFTGWRFPVPDDALEYFVFPFIIWAAIRFSQPTTTLVVLASSVISIWGTLQGQGPFVTGSPNESLFLLETFLAAIAITGLTVAAATAERSAVERQVRESHGFLSAITEGTSDAIFVKDLDGRYLMINPAGARFLGKSVEEVLGKDDTELFSLETAREIILRDKRIMLSGVTQTYEDVGTAAGVTRTYLSTKGPYRDENGNVVGLIGIARDITERKEYEERLKRESAFRQAIEDSMPAGVAAVDLDGRQSYVNPEFCRIVGFHEDELLGAMPPFVYWPPEEVEAIERAFDAARRAEGSVGGFELRFLRRGGGRFDALVLSSKLVDSSGNVSGWLHSVSDISGRKAMEEALRHSEERYRSLVLASAQVVWTTDAHGQVVEDLPTWRAFTGQTAEAMRGWGWMERVHPEDRPQAKKVWERSLATRTSHVHEFRVLAWDGSYRHVLARALPIREPDGRLREWIGTWTDVTERKRAEQERAQLLEREKALRAEADAANRQKDEFLGMLGHELRNPLAPIRNALDITRRERDPTTLDWVLGVIDRQTRHLTRLVDDLLDVSRITRGRIELRKEPADLREILQQAVEASEPYISSREHTLEVSMPNEPLTVFADTTRLEQVFVNLLNNAAKYTEPKGHIAVSAGLVDGEAVVSVRDDGIGIPPDLLPRVFDVFSQADRSLARSQGGLGIGLTLVKKLVEMHEGKVEARSAGNAEGSEFVVRLPRLENRPPGEKSVSAVEASKAPLRVLLVEDNLDSARSLAMLLELHGHDVRVVHDGPAALEAVSWFDPVVVLLDIGLPGMDGYEVARRLRSDGASMLLVALTGYGRDSDRRRSREAGFDDLLVKPVEPDHLLTLFASLARVSGRADSGPHS